MKMRITQHNARKGKDGTFSALHNDRNFDVSNAEHIDPERSENNLYWHRYMRDDRDMSFEEAEKKFYEKYFKAALDAKNEKNIKQRHPERVKTMDQYRSSPKSCPEEQIIQIGRKGETIDAKQMMQIITEQLAWEAKRFPNYEPLDIALHMDEEGAPHVHRRGVWVAHDDQGRCIVGQSRALAEMGVERPNPDKPISKYNNAKMTYTRECREHFAAVCLAHGLEIELQPKDRSKTGLSLVEYQAQQEEEKARQAQLEQQMAANAQQQILQQNIAMVNENARIASEMKKTKESTLKLQNELKTAQTALEHVKAEHADMLSREEFSKKLLTSEQTKSISTKPAAFAKDKVVVSKEDFRALVRTAAAAENLMAQSAEANKILKRRNAILEAAEKEAAAKINNIDNKLATIELQKIKKDHPELFKNGRYRAEKEHQKSQIREHSLGDQRDR